MLDEISELLGSLKLRQKFHWANTTAEKVLCGIELRVLREHYFGKRYIKGGRPRKRDIVGEFKSWDEMTIEKIGISEATAANWINMADAVETLAERGGNSIRETCKKFSSNWTAEETALVQTIVHKICDGKSQNEILTDHRLRNSNVKAAKSPVNNGAAMVPTLSDASELAKKLRQEATELKSKATKLEQSAARLALFGHDFDDQSPRPGSEAFWLNGLFEKKQAAGNADLASYLNKHEREQILAQILKPVLEAWVASGK